MSETAEKRPVVLVIDDDEANRKLLNVLLRREGIHPLVFERGEEGLSRLREETPDLILLDVFLPGQDGFQILKRIKSNPKTADVPVVMFTVLGREKSRRRALEMGACAYVTKPFDMNHAVALIRDLLSGERTCAENRAVP
ncbi:MAG: two-component system response regulator [Desulfococcaceae bacterium]